MWLYSLTFQVLVEGIIGRYATPGVTRTDTVSFVQALQRTKVSIQYIKAAALGLWYFSKDIGSLT